MDGISGGTNAAFQKGQRVGQYQIVEVLTPTRFGHIYLGQHMYQPIHILIEGLQPPLLDEFKEDFLKYAQALKNLEHPHILCIRDMGVQENCSFLVTDYLPYRTFKQVYAPKSTQPLITVLPHLKMIASALQYAHSKHILHGDIRPENILLSKDNNILLRGFLFEAIMHNREHLNHRGAEAAEYDAMIYAAPEQIQGNISSTSDQYALGVLIYKLLCGKAPFTGSSVEIAFQKIHASAPSLRRKIPNLISPEVERVVMKALEKEPERRFPDVQTFINTLEQEQNQLSRNLAPSVPVQPVGVTSPPLVSPSVIPSTVPMGFSGASPTFQAPPPSFLAATPQAPVPSIFQGVAPMRVTPPDSLPQEPLGHLPQELKKTMPKQLPPPSKPPARRPGGTSVTRRVFAIGLVGIAALGGAGGWYLLSQRFSHAAPPVVSSNTGPSATQTIINNQKGLIFTGHLASVNAVAWSPDGKFIASASDDTFVQIFESATGTRRIIYKGHTEEVAAVAWSPNGHFIASAGQDRTVQVWNAASGGTPVLIYKGHTDRVNSVSWSSNGYLLASGSDDKSVQVWQASSGDHTFTFLGHTAGVLCVGWQPDDSSVASGSWDGTLRDWATTQHGDHFKAGDQIFKYDGHGNNEVYALAWSPDSNFIVSAGADQTVQISNGDDGTPRLPFFTDHRRKDHIDRVFAVSWSPDGTSIASGDEDGNVYVWRTAGRKTFFKYTGHKGAVNAVAWSPDGNFIASASADNTVHVWQPS
ncbi:MAG TPA: protein kinase [Ktedonobacteraceae bacterium]|jgi:serine/threonine protein kinase